MMRKNKRMGKNKRVNGFPREVAETGSNTDALDYDTLWVPAMEKLMYKLPDAQRLLLIPLYKSPYL
jgi:hypothetical protein